jgi:hypothetical protein
VHAVNTVVAFYDIHGRKGTIFCSVPDTRLIIVIYIFLFFFLLLCHQVGLAQHVFHHVVIRQLFLRAAACLTSTLLETGVTTANTAGTNSLKRAF